MSDTPAQSDAADAAADRRVLMVDGVRWTVRVIASTYDRRHRPDLLFESEYIVRRVREYPDDWQALSDERLFALSRRR